MISFIEDNTQLLELNDKNVIVIPIIDEKIHFLYEDITAIFLLDVDSKKEYMINIKHPDYIIFNGQLNTIECKLAMVTDKKTLINKNMISSNSVDMNFLIYPEHHKTFEFHSYVPKSYLLFQNRFVNWSVYPLTVLIKMCQLAGYDMFLYYKKHIEFIKEIQKIDNLYYNSLFNTEITPLEFNYDLIYSNYNPYTLTNRPTNSSFGINLSALSKKDDTRSKLKPINKENKLVQFDYSSFHVYLLTKILDFELPVGTDIYLYLNEQYKFSSKNDRNDIKMDFFRYIYGTREYESKLSKIINNFKDNLFAQFQNDGYVVSFFLKRKIFFNTKNIDQSNKLFNYYLQNAETEYNLLKIQSILNQLKTTQSNLILYTYDSFLFEINKDDIQVLTKIKDILQEDGIPVTTQIGSNYKDLTDIY